MLFFGFFEGGCLCMYTYLVTLQKIAEMLIVHAINQC